MRLASGFGVLPGTGLAGSSSRRAALQQASHGSHGPARRAPPRTAPSPRRRPPRPAPTLPLLRSFKSFVRARAQGRTHVAYEPGIPFGQAYEKLPWLHATLRALGGRKNFFTDDMVIQAGMRAPLAAAAALAVAT